MKSIKKNYIYNLFYQLLIIILLIVTTPYIARTLGPNGVGTFSYVVSITTYFILFGSLGISLYGQREIAYNQDNKEARSEIFFELVVLRFITMLFSIILFYFFLVRNNELSIYYKILLLELLANCIDISWFFQGIEEFKKIVIRNLIIKILSICCIFLFIHDPDDLIAYVIIYVLNTFVSNFMLWFNIKKYICISTIKNINPFKHLKNVIVLFIPQIAIQIYTVLDKVMIGFILNDMAEVGYYEQSQKIIKMLMAVLTSMSTVMLPRIASHYAKKESDKICLYMYKTFRFIIFLAIPMILGICSVSKNFVPLFFGNGYDKVAIIMCILSFILLFIGISAAIGNQYLLTTKKQKEYTVSVVLGACVNFVFNIVLIKKFMSIGAAIATVIAELFVTSIQLFFIRKDFKISKILSDSKNYFISGIFMFVICVLVDLIILNNLLSICIQVVVGIISYTLILFLLKDEYFIAIFNNLIKILKKTRKKLGK